MAHGIRGRRLAALTFLVVALLLPAPPSRGASGEGYVAGLSTYPIRDVPQFAADPTGRIDIGLKVQILEEKSGWVRIKLGDTTGWMPSSVIGSKAPPNVQLSPLRDRVQELEGRLGRLEAENKSLEAENGTLAEKAASLDKELDKERRSAERSTTYKRTWDIALGGGLVIFGWITGYALASSSRRRDSKRKYVLD